MDELETQLSRQSAVQKSIVTGELRQTQTEINRKSGTRYSREAAHWSDGWRTFNGRK